MRGKWYRVSAPLVLIFLLHALPALGQTPASAAVNVSAMGKVIPKDFAGLSVEVGHAARNYFGPAGAPNRVVFQLLRNLGTGVIRVGGNSTDRSCWDAASAPKPALCGFAITLADVQGFAQASAATGWKFIVGINLGQDSAAWALPYGAALANAFRDTPGAQLAALELGNEPDIYGHVHKRPTSLGNLFVSTPLRPASYDWEALAKEWESYSGALESDPATRGVPLAGPGYCCEKRFLRNLGPFLDAAGPGLFGLVTLHKYPTTTCNGGTVSPAELLARSLLVKYEALERPEVAMAHASGLPVALAESNSSSCGGQRGVSDRVAAALWGLDWLFTNFRLGMVGVNFHNAAGGWYDPITAVPRTALDGTVRYTDGVRPLYYAVYAFAHFAEGEALLPVSVQSAANIKVYATRATSSSPVHVFVVNKELMATASVTLHPSEPMGEGELLVASGAGVESPSLRYGGTQIDAQTGRLSAKPQSSEIQPDSEGDYHFLLPNAGFAVLTISPRRP